MSATKTNWQPVQFTADCDPNGDGWCIIRDCDLADCPCLGPTQVGVEYREVNGVLMGRYIKVDGKGECDA